ncbi:MAG: ASCH domain-containing protein [Planctomycetota bacterium]|nr:ASCH domain-containing protein [Planctomycetota bacterium]
MIHVAVVRGPYLEAMLTGRKTIESRLTVTRREPFGVAAAGERIYFKEPGGPFRVTALIGRTLEFAGLTPSGVRLLRRRYGKLIGGDEAYWSAKLGARYAALMYLEAVEEVCGGPVHPAFHGRAWMRLPTSACVYPGCLGDGGAGGAAGAAKPRLARAGRSGRTRRSA